MLKTVPVFKLEDYFVIREFSSKYMLGSADVECLSLKELLAMADEECKALWENLDLGYTETAGLPLLRTEIAKQYEGIKQEHVHCFAGAQEGIFAAVNTILGEGDHAIVMTPCYQSLKDLPKAICEVSEVEIKYEENWELDIDRIEAAIRPNIKLILINFPHNPTGTILSKEKFQKLVSVARKNDIWIFSDEVYREGELDPADRLPAAAEAYEKGISLSVTSKAYGLPGLRVGWLVCRDEKMLHEIAKKKHYLSICNSAPSEILTLILLRNKSKILARNHDLLVANSILLEQFLQKYSNYIEGKRSMGGCMMFVKIKTSMDAYTFCEKLRETLGVLMLPGTLYDVKEPFIRLGFGKKDFPHSLKKLEEFLVHHLSA